MFSLRIVPEKKLTNKDITLEQLFSEAEQYGFVRVYSSNKSVNRSRGYKVTIEFETVPGVLLEAGSEYGLSLHDALVEAVERASLIVKK